MNHTTTSFGRRKFLQGAGVGLSLPLLDAFLPRACSATVQMRQTKMVCICTSLGLHAPFLFPKQTGANYAMTPYLEILKEHRRDFTLFSGLSHPDQSGANGHSSEMSWLTAARYPGLGGFKNTVSFDQLAAEHIGLKTRFPSLVLGTGSPSISYTRSGVMIPAESRPSRVFAKLFLQGTAADIERQVQKLQEGQSILDTVQAEARSFSRRVGTADRDKLNEYFDSVRELEQRLVKSEAWAQKPKPRIEEKAPTDITNGSDLIGRMRLLFDLIPLALQTDSTRLITVFLQGANAVPPVAGVTIDHHNLSHHGQEPEKIKQLRLIETEQFRVFGDLMRKLKAKREVGGPLFGQYVSHGRDAEFQLWRSQRWQAIVAFELLTALPKHISASRLSPCELFKLISENVMPRNTFALSSDTISTLGRMLIALLTISFLASAVAHAQDTAAKGKLYELRIYRTNPGKLPDLHARFRDHTMKLFEKHGMENIIYWDVSEGAKGEEDIKDNLLVYIIAHRDEAAREASWKGFRNDPEWKEAAAQSEVNGKILAKAPQAILMRETDFSSADPISTTNPDGSQKLFELRQYNDGPDGVPSTVDRFGSGEKDIFTKNGMETVKFWTATDNSAFIYLLAHKDREASRKSWEGFMPEFRTFMQEYRARNPKNNNQRAQGGQAQRKGHEVRFLVPTNYSPRARRRGNRRPPVRSPEIGADGKVTFRLQVENADEVQLRGQWPDGTVAMERGENNVWHATVGPVPPGVWEYGYRVDGLAMIDPHNSEIKPMRSPRTSILHMPGDSPQQHDFQDVPHGTVHLHTYHSKSLGHLRELAVYTPPSYEKARDQRFPTLYLQHGSGDNEATWTKHGKAHWIVDNLIAQQRAKPMVIVMMDGHASPPNAPRGAGTSYFEKDLLQDVLPFVEANYRVLPDAANRGIVGLSMGGGQSLTIGLNHSDKFAWVGGFSSAVGRDRVSDALDNPERTNERLKLLWIACGKDDFLLARNEAFTEELKQQGIKHEWHLTDGDHSWPVWRRYLADFVPKLF